MRLSRREYAFWGTVWLFFFLFGAISGSCLLLLYPALTNWILCGAPLCLAALGIGIGVLVLRINLNA